MFNDCENLSYIKVHFTEWAMWDDEALYDKWVAGVASTGTFVCPKELDLIYGEGRIPEGWNIVFLEEETESVNCITGEDTASCGVQVWTENGAICVRGAEDMIEVLGVKGELLRTLRGNGSEIVRFTMPAGRAYIIKIGKQGVKVLL